MKGKLIFSIILIALLAIGTYGTGGGSTGNTANPTTAKKTPDEPAIEIAGLVERPYNITLNELRNMTPKVVYADLYCVDSPNLPRKSGKWVGVPLKTLLERAAIRENAVKVALYARDGYTTDLKIEDVLADEDIIVAYEYNGNPIKPRLVVPGRWGYKWIKDIVKIEVVDYNFLGTWEKAGYPDDAYVENGSKPWR